MREIEEEERGTAGLYIIRAAIFLGFCSDNGSASRVEGLAVITVSYTHLTLPTIYSV